MSKTPKPLNVTRPGMSPEDDTQDVNAPVSDELAAMPARSMPDNISDDAMYEVQMARAVKWKGTVLRPDAKVMLKGSVVKELGDGVYSAVEAQA